MMIDKLKYIAQAVRNDFASTSPLSVSDSYDIISAYLGFGSYEAMICSPGVLDLRAGTVGFILGDGLSLKDRLESLNLDLDYETVMVILDYHFQRNLYCFTISDDLDRDFINDIMDSYSWHMMIADPDFMSGILIMEKAGRFDDADEQGSTRGDAWFHKIRKQSFFQPKWTPALGISFFAKGDAFLQNGMNLELDYSAEAHFPHIVGRFFAIPYFENFSWGMRGVPYI